MTLNSTLAVKNGEQWENKAKVLSDLAYLISNWGAFDLCEAELGLACDFHDILKAATMPAGEHRIKLCSSHLRFTELLDFIPEKNM